MTHPNSLDLEAFACGETRAAVTEHLESCEACRTWVERVQNALGAEIKNVAPMRASRLSLAWVLVPLAAAAAFLVFLHPGGETPKPVATNEPVSTTDPTVTFKGTLPIAVVRERGGDQSRFVGTVAVRPDDRLRVEVALDRDEVILAGVLGDDGSWLELMPAVSRSAGTHFSDHSARVDSSPLRGTILVGAPAAVTIARTTHRFDGVASLRIEWEAP